MPRTSNEASIQCPFYKTITTKNINCEGVTETCNLSLMFISSEEKELYRRLYCERQYKDCKVCKMLESKYDD